MEVDKLISTLNGMIISSDSNPNTDEWVKDFLIEIKLKLQEQQKEIDFWKDLSESCECNN